VPGQGTRQRRAGILLSIVVSSAAIALATVHLAFPSLEIDTVTIGLLVIALLPWLAPIINSIEIPGVVRFELRQTQEELRRTGEKVQSLAGRVERVEQFVFSGATPAQERTLSDALAQFVDYLRSLGVDLREDLPSIRIDDENETTAFYDGGSNQITLGSSFADDADVALRQYSNAVLASLSNANTTYGAGAVQSGMAYYLPCSFNERPLYGIRAASRVRQYGFHEPALANLENTLSFAQVQADRDLSALVGGAVWGGVFWEIRGLLGKESADLLLLDVWRSVDSFSEDLATTEFARPLLERVRNEFSDHVDAVYALFERRGLNLSVDAAS
jgi:hypothetical protein